MKALPHGYHAIIFNYDQYSEQLFAQQCFRKLLFIDELGWNLDTLNDREIDEFDNENAVYCSLYFENQIVGCWRAIRTSDEYLGKKYFPQLASHHSYPVDQNIWEISRLGVIRHKNRPMNSLLTYSLMFYFGLSRFATSLTGVVSEFHNKHLEISGVKTFRYGKTLTIEIDTKGRPIEVFFGGIPITEQRPEVMQKFLNLTHLLELDDEALILGPERISA